MADPEVEIFWPASLPTTGAAQGQELLRQAGIDSECLLMPTRRGAVDVVQVLVTSAVLEPFLHTLFQRVAEETHHGLRAFVDRLLRRPPEDSTAPTSVVFELPTGGRVTFTDGLPEEAYKQAVGLDARNARWTWDPQRALWTPA
ncbi:hypothetical protein J2Z21_000376 [Streptomyces griseochromogenes]|uniref:Uncharacterized protein n=1 Tax=Streptomyces griseochromogenes TaxID=68214 RepID=A0A1B1B1Y1_9ACTN|nr:hypothetical protein [Streptomyces griseochromogenes]ANP52833.1 hypothetical protein AVL59_27750 [Streptomyces griseochromogenes]MBP2047454.1 hypothetical protein [Streptomyces griseochromogenes]